MATYVIGDLQGHLCPLDRLLARVAFDPARDRIIVAGDLVNRGPDSVGVLRRLAGLGDAATAVLGNHDIYALARWVGVIAVPEKDETLGALLAAPDSDELFAWLSRRPLILEAEGCLVVHAGVPPAWDAAELRSRATEASHLLSGSERDTLLERVCSRRRNDDGAAPSDPIGRAAATIGLLTRLRLVDPAGNAIKGAGPLERAPAGALPWFRHPSRPRAWRRIVFGHWATLGLWVEADIAAIDTGYVWGGALTALRLDDGALFAVRPDPALGL